MITNLHIKNFKCHKDTNLALGNLTLLCGQNGVGKSSAIQSLLLLRQTASKQMFPVGLSLNKPLCYIGEAKDAISQPFRDKIVEFTLKYKNFSEDKSSFDEIEQIFDYLMENEQLDYIKSMRPTGVFLGFGYFANTNIFSHNFQYVSALRGIVYERSDYDVEIKKQISIEEGKAELAAHFLCKYQNELILPEMLHTSETNNTLLAQTTAWEREISKGIKVIPKKEGETYTIHYIYEGSEQEFTAKNVGFGISYSLPVIVAILSAKKGALILIENPEAHLHPYGQAKLAELMCIAAQAGIQIIVETHSDHIVNGVLVQCKRFEQAGKGVNRENVRIHYFERAEDSTACNTTEVEILEGGRITYPPVGFFDQISKDRKTLMGF